MSVIPRLLGMVHLLALPGAPDHAGSMTDVLETAIADATILAHAGFPALMIENIGDAPFFANRVPPETVAALTMAVRAVMDTTRLPIGVNVLRNDGLSALAIAAATGASLIRVNVLTGTMYTDQGPIVGEAAALLRKRAILCPEVEIWADVMVKHATAPAGVDPAQLALDTIERGRADALIISGPGTGAEPDHGQAAAIRDAVPKGTRLVIGSGATPENLPALLELADTVIVGSSIKFDGVATARVDPDRVEWLLEAARENGLVSA